MKLQDFTGGLSTRLRPQFLPINQAVEYLNIDSSKGTLVGDKGRSLTELDLDQYMFYFEEEEVWISEPLPTSFLEYQGSVYSADGSAPARYKDGNKYQLGITAPAINDWDATEATAPGSGLSGTYTYVLTFYDINSGIESGPTDPTEEYTVGPEGEISFLDLPVSADPQVTHKRLYRVGGANTLYTLAAEIPNATVVYTDTKADVDLGPDLLQTEGYTPAPNGLTFIAEYNGMLFGCEGPRLYFTPVGLPGSWSVFNFLTYARTVIGCAKVPNGLLVLTDTEAHLVTGQTHTTLRSRLVDSEQGCVAWESVQAFGNTAVWVSRFGICASSGGEALVVSLDRLGPVRFSPQSSAVINKVYYMLDSSGTVTAMDSRFTLTFKNYNFDVSSLAPKINELYGWTSDGVYHLLDEAAAPLEWFYKSPRFVEGGSSELKAYKKFYMYSLGTVNVKILIDNEEVYDSTFTEEGEHELQVPTDDQRGQFVQFELSGTGEVYELEYLAEGAKR